MRNINHSNGAKESNAVKNETEFIKKLDDATRVSASKVGFAGIKWKTSNADIELLNDIVFRKTTAFVEDSERTGGKLSPEVFEVYKNNRPVYKKRYTFLPMLYGGISILTLLYHIFVYKRPLIVLLACLFSFFWYDLFSGILHVTLDNPDFISTPVLNDPCLEFQWHHHIPLDLCSKSFLEVCGDLNVTATIIGVIMLCPGIGCFEIRNPVGLCLLASKTLFAYYGQMCHMFSHMPSNQCPKWAKSLQNCGLMVSPLEHSKHHKMYNDNFCIGTGMCNSIITFLLNKVTKNKWVWLVLFLSVTAFDVPVMNRFMTNVLQMEK